jgi:hypothetical protein
MEHRSTSELQVFGPHKTSRVFGRLVLLGTALLVGVGAWVLFEFKGAFPHVGTVCACAVFLALAFIVAFLTDLLRGRNLRVCLNKDTLTVTRYYSAEQVKFSDIDEVLDSVESILIVTPKRKIKVDDFYFNSADEKARFFSLLHSRVQTTRKS